MMQKTASFLRVYKGVRADISLLGPTSRVTNTFKIAVVLSFLSLGAWTPFDSGLAALAASTPLGTSQDKQDKPQPAAVDADGLEFFEKKIRPVLIDKCYSCHSADAKKIKGGLRLDTREATLKGG